MKLHDALEEYRLACAAVPVSAATWRWYEQKLKTFIDYLKSEFGVSHVEGIQVKHVNRFTEWLGNTPTMNGRGVRSTYTIKGYIECAKNFLSWAVAEDLIAAKVRDRVPLPKVEQKTIKTFSRAQYDHLMNAAQFEKTRALQLRDRAILAILLDTGIRAEEMCGLTVANVRLGEDTHVSVHGKGNKHREVGPLGIETQRHLRRHLRGHDSDLLFVSRYHQAMTPSGLDQLLYRLRDWAGADHFAGIRVSAHTFRHTYAVNFMRGGGDIYTLSLLLGHTSVSTTQNYLKDFQQKEARQGKSVLDTF